MLPEIIFDRLFPLQRSGTWEWPQEIKLHTRNPSTDKLSDDEARLVATYGKAMCWGVFVGGAILSRWLLDHPEEVRGKVIEDWGSGSGIVAIAAALSGAKHVIAVDSDPLSIEVIKRNAIANNVENQITPVSGNVLKRQNKDAEIITASEIFYSNEQAFQTALLREANKGRTVFAVSYHDDNLMGRLAHAGESLRPRWPFNFSAASSELMDHPDLQTQKRRQRLIKNVQNGNFVCRKLTKLTL